MAVRKRGSGWLIDIKLRKGQGRIYHTFHGTEAEAWEMEQAMRREVNQSVPSYRYTVSSKLIDYLEYVRNNQSENTYRHKKMLFFTRIIPFFGNMYLSAISQIDIERYKTKRKSEIASVTAKGGTRTINLELTYLAALMRWAGIPLKWKEIPYHKQLPIVLDRDEIQRFLEALEPKYKLLFTLLYVAGLRKSEALNLKMGDISGDNITIQGKGGTWRSIPVNIGIVQEIAKNYVGVPTASPLIFPFVNIYKAIARARKKAGITKRINPHLLRHSMATHLVESTGDLRTIQEILGHKSISTTTIYTHIAMEHKRDVLNTLGYNGLQSNKKEVDHDG